MIASGKVFEITIYLVVKVTHTYASYYMSSCHSRKEMRVICLYDRCNLN